MKGLRLWLLLCLIGLAGAMPSLAAAEEIRAHADRVTGQIKNKDQDIVVLEGNVRVTQGKTKIQADRAVYDKKAGTMIMTGRVQLTQEDITVKAEELTYYRQTKEGTFRGAVHLVRPEIKDEAGKVTKDGLVLDCDTLIFAAEKKSFTASGRVRLEHKDFTATAGEIVYEDAKQEMTLRQEPLLVQDDEEIRAEEIIISVETDSFRILNAEITFAVEEKTAEEETGGATDGGSKPPAP